MSLKYWEKDAVFTSLKQSSLHQSVLKSNFDQSITNDLRLTTNHLKTKFKQKIIKQNFKDITKISILKQLV